MKPSRSNSHTRVDGDPLTHRQIIYRNASLHSASQTLAHQFRAIDGSQRTEWSSDGDGNDAYIIVALPEVHPIDSIAVHTRTMADDTAQIFAFTVTDRAGNVYGPFELPNADEPHLFPLGIETDLLRFDVVDSNGGNTGFVDLAAFASD